MANKRQPVINSGERFLMPTIGSGFGDTRPAHPLKPLASATSEGQFPIARQIAEYLKKYPEISEVLDQMDVRESLKVVVDSTVYHLNGRRKE